MANPSSSLSARAFLVGCLLCGAAVCWAQNAIPVAQDPQASNLVPNPGFERGDTAQPAQWTLANPLTHFWESGGLDGRFLRFDTDVYLREVRGADKWTGQPPRKTPPTGNRYDTVAGTEGVRSWSAPIRVEPGRRYLMQVDVKGSGGHRLSI